MMDSKEYLKSLSQRGFGKDQIELHLLCEILNVLERIDGKLDKETRSESLFELLQQKSPQDPMPCSNCHPIFYAAGKVIKVDEVDGKKLCEKCHKEVE